MTSVLLYKLLLHFQLGKDYVFNILKAEKYKFVIIINFFIMKVIFFRKNSNLIKNLLIWLENLLILLYLK